MLVAHTTLLFYSRGNEKQFEPAHEITYRIVEQQMHILVSALTAHIHNVRMKVRTRVQHVDHKPQHGGLKEGFPHLLFVFLLC